MGAWWRLPEKNPFFDRFQTQWSTFMDRRTPSPLLRRWKIRDIWRVLEWSYESRFDIKLLPRFPGYGERWICNRKLRNEAVLHEPCLHLRWNKKNGNRPTPESDFVLWLLTTSNCFTGEIKFLTISCVLRMSRAVDNNYEIYPNWMLTFVISHKLQQLFILCRDLKKFLRILKYFISLHQILTKTHFSAHCWLGCS